MFTENQSIHNSKKMHGIQSGLCVPLSGRSERYCPWLLQGREHRRRKLAGECQFLKKTFLLNKAGLQNPNRSIKIKYDNSKGTVHCEEAEILLRKIQSGTNREYISV